MKEAYPAPFGRYLLTERLASGGMAEIFKAKLVGVEGFEKTLVIKRIHPFWSERRDFITMLVDEAKLLVYLNHPNIVQVYELGREGPSYFIAMELVEGVDLRQLQQRLKSLQRPMPPEIAVAVTIETLKGLYYAHERSLKERGRLGIVHRDVSPQNILLSFEGEVKVTDFGIAKAMTQTHETQTGVLKGKYAYMSPEQAVGRGLDHRSDLFSTGIMLWEMLFERRLFAGKNDLETLENVRTASVPWPEDGAARLFPGLREVLDRALQLSPESRFASAEEFAEALEACLPREKRVGRRELAKFLSEIFAEEIQHRRQLAQEIQHKTESFLRQTKVGPPEDEPTISLVESKTELEARPAAEPKPPPASAPARGAFPSWIWSFALLFLLLPTAYGIWKIPKAEKREAPTVTGQASVVATAPTIPVASPVPESRPTVSPPQASPVPLRGTLNLKVLPEGAQLKAVFPGGPRQGRGELNLEGLAPGTLVQVSASMANFETQTKSFTIRENPSAQNDVFKLEKKTPAFGEIRVNAVPWGRVSIPGLVVGGETPVTRSRIPEGRYPVSVTNPTLHQTLTATAVVRGGKTTQCHADFEGRGGISCR